jgi:hypothetical protein
MGEGWVQNHFAQFHEACQICLDQSLDGGLYKAVPKTTTEVKWRKIKDGSVILILCELVSDYSG